jgi:hypothetical protein
LPELMRGGLGRFSGRFGGVEREQEEEEGGHFGGG